MHLVAALDAAQDRHRVVERRLVDRHRLEAPGQRRVLLDVAAVFLGRGRADAAQLAARQGRLQHVGGVDRPVDAAGADQHVQLVDKEDDLAVGRLDLGEDRFQPLLEFAAELGAGQHLGQVERQEAPVLQPLGHVAGGEALGQPLDDRGLADAGVADEDRVVLGAPGEHLDRAADFVVAADHRVELALPRLLGQVARVFRQRLPVFLGRRRVGGAALAQLFERLLQRLGIDRGAGEQVAQRRREPREQPLGGDEAVAAGAGRLGRALQHAGKLRRHIDRVRPVGVDRGQPCEPLLGAGPQQVGIAAGIADDPAGEPVGVVDHRLEQMLGKAILVTAGEGRHLRRLQQAARSLGEIHEVHDGPSLHARPPGGAGRRRSRPAQCAAAGAVSNRWGFSRPNSSASRLPRCGSEG